MPVKQVWFNHYRGSDVAIMKDFGEDISQSSSSGISSSTLTSDLMPDEELDVELEKYYELLQVSFKLRWRNCA